MYLVEYFSIFIGRKAPITFFMVHIKLSIKSLKTLDIYCYNERLGA